MGRKYCARNGALCSRWVGPMGRPSIKIDCQLKTAFQQFYFRIKISSRASSTVGLIRIFVKSKIWRRSGQVKVWKCLEVQLRASWILTSTNDWAVNRCRLVGTSSWAVGPRSPASVVSHAGEVEKFRNCQSRAGRFHLFWVKWMKHYTLRYPLISLNEGVGLVNDHRPWFDALRRKSSARHLSAIFFLKIHWKMNEISRRC